MSAVLTYKGLQVYDTKIKEYINNGDAVVCENTQQQIDTITDKQSEYERRLDVLNQNTIITIADLDVICK